MTTFKSTTGNAEITGQIVFEDADCWKITQSQTNGRVRLDKDSWAQVVNMPGGEADIIKQLADALALYTADDFEMGGDTIKARRHNARFQTAMQALKIAVEWRAQSGK